LYYQHKFKDAEEADRKAIDLKPDDVFGYNNLGSTLHSQKQFREAEAAFRKAIELKPDFAIAHFNLGHALIDQKKLVEAVSAYRKADQLLPGNSTIQSNLRRSERFLELDQRLPAILAGKEQPRSPEERLEFAAFCAEYKHLYFAALRLYSAAFAADPKWADALSAGHRYNAACAAALAAAGKGEDAKDLGVEEWAGLQQRAYDWLRADLAAHARLVEQGDQQTRRFVQQTLAHWLEDEDLIAVRDPDWLAAMPETDRARWERLWSDVATLQKTAAAGPK
jgi:hypothetical protein